MFYSKTGLECRDRLPEILIKEIITACANVKEKSAEMYFVRLDKYAVLVNVKLQQILEGVYLLWLMGVKHS